MTGDPYKDFDRWDIDQWEAEKKQPQCCMCGKAIWDDSYWDIMDAIYCEDCAIDNYRRYTDDYEG